MQGEPVWQRGDAAEVEREAPLEVWKSGVSRLRRCDRLLPVMITKINTSATKYINIPVHIHLFAPLMGLSVDTCAGLKIKLCFNSAIFG